MNDPLIGYIVGGARRPFVVAEQDGASLPSTAEATRWCTRDLQQVFDVAIDVATVAAADPPFDSTAWSLESRTQDELRFTRSQNVFYGGGGEDESQAVAQITLTLSGTVEPGGMCATWSLGVATT